MDTDPDQHWCGRLYEERGAALLLYARSLGLTQGEAEDVLQETFQALLQMASAPDRADRYVIRAVRNRALNHRRSFLRRLRREAVGDLWFEPAPVSADREEAAMRMLARLPGKQREVIVLKIWHQHTFEEIGELLSVSPNTISARYRYGLTKLRAALQHEEDQNERQGTESHRGASLDLDPEKSFASTLSASLASPPPTGLAS